MPERYTVGIPPVANNIYRSVVPAATKYVPLSGITAAPNESEVELNLCLQEQTKQAGKKENGRPKRVLCSDCNKKRVMFVLLYVKKLTPVS